MASNQEKLEKLLAGVAEGVTCPLELRRRAETALDQAFADGLLASPFEVSEAGGIIAYVAADIQSMEIDINFTTEDTEK